MLPHLQSEKVMISSIQKDTRNARKHDARNLKAIKESLLKFGQVEPLVVQKSSQKIIGGNGRHAAMLALGWKDCDVVQLDIDDEKATALGLVLNRSAELAEWDNDTLGALLSELDEGGWDLDGLGFNAEDLKMILDQEFQPNIKDENDDENNIKHLLTITFANEDDQQELFLELRDRGFKVKA